MGFNELTAKLKSKNITGVFVLYGNEEYTKDFYIRKIRAFTAAAPSPEYADIVLQGEDLTPDSLADAVDTPAFMSEWKIIEIVDFPVNQSPSVLSAYTDILSDIPDGVCVAFIYRAGDFDDTVFAKNKDGSNELLDFLSKGAICVNFEEQTGAKLITWIQKHFESRNVPIEQSAVAFLTEFCGNDMYILSGEIEKLCSYYNEKPISINDIKLVCCANSDYKLFDIVNCLSQGNAAKLKSVYDGLVYAKTAPEIILGTVGNYFSDMLNVKTGIENGVSPNEIKKMLGMADWQYSRTSGATKNTSADFIKKAIDCIKEADYIVKNQSSDPYTVIEIMLYRIMSYGKNKA